LLSWFLSLAVFFVPLSSLVILAVQDERYSYTLAVPVISVFVVWLRKDRIFTSEARKSSIFALPLLLAGTVLACVAWGGSSLLGRSSRLSLAVLAVLLVWIGAFALCYGTRALRSAAFPAAFLILMIPVPASAMDNTGLLLQQGSAEMTDRLFRIVGIPFLRDGFRFSLPGVDIEIAEECSGIRSSSSLFVCSLLIANMFIRTNWRRASFALLTIPIVILKNAIRIVAISWLGIRVDPGFWYGSLHHRGGLVFSMLALGMMASVLWALKKSEAGQRADSRSRLDPKPASGE
jgi:exosortase